MTKYNFKYILFFIIIFSTLTFSYLNLTSYTSAFDHKIREVFFKIHGEIPTPNTIVIVNIDEKSIKELGQWPFNRGYIAQVLVNLANAQANIIGMDLLLSEEDTSPPSNIAKILGIQKDFQNNDLLLGEVIANTPTVLSYYFTNKHIYKNNKTPNVPTTFKTTNKNTDTFIRASGIITNIPEIQNRAYSSGFSNSYNSKHNRITKMPLVLSYNDRLYPSLALEMIRVSSQTKEIKIIEDTSGIKGLQLKEFFIPTDINGFLTLNNIKAKNSFKYLSFIDVLNGNFNSSDINNKFVLIGTSINTLVDLNAIIYDLAIPKIEIHANIIDNILKNNFLYQHTSASEIDTITIFCLTIILGLIYLSLNTFTIIPLFLIVTSGLYSFYYYLFFNNGFVVNLFYPFVAIMTTTLFAILINYFHRRRLTNIIQNKFAKKVSPAVVNDLIDQKIEKVATHTKDITICFSNLRGFTSLIRQVNNPKKRVDLLNLYMELMINEIIKTEGTIDKFMSTTIMAYWNDPKELKDHQKLAVRTALKQLEQFELLKVKIKKEYSINLEMDIAIHSGNVTVGEIGFKETSDYTIIGDNVNLVSKILEFTKTVGVKFIITEAVKNRLDDEYILRKLANVSLKGESNSILLYELICHKDEKPKNFDELNQKYEEAIKLYENQEFEKAIHAFELVDFNYHHRINQLYIDEAKKYLKNPNLQFSLKFTITDK